MLIGNSKNKNFPQLKKMIIFFQILILSKCIIYFKETNFIKDINTGHCVNTCKKNS